MDKKWYQNNLVIIALLILFFPVGLFLMWKYAGWNKTVKWIITAVFALAIVGGALSPSKSNTTPASVPAQSQPEIRSSPTPTPKVINYEIFQRWDIPNGGEGKVVIISPEHLNEQDMPLLGEKLKNDTQNDRNAFIYVFTDKKAAALRDKVFDDLAGKSTMSEAESDFYDKNYVAQYTKNGNSGFHEFVIYYDGVMGTNSKTIKY
ncbi:MAG: hypothetical protein HY426_04155 [Candidatus Levybacteria bacterium]|nr:hypothetical protein [Candidatus Levybacteria bacterium]